MEAFGDLARTLVLRSNQVRLRQQMDTLAVEVATGVVKDSARHLGGDTTLLNSLDRSLARLETFRVNTAEAQLVTTTMQTALGGIQDSTERLAQSLLAADLTPSENLLNTLSGEAQQTLGKVLGNLNSTVAGRFVFAGVQTDQPAVAGLDTLMAALRTEVAGATDLAAIETAIDGFFGAGGTFESTIYTGSDTGLAPLQLSETESASVDIRATDEAMRALLKPLAMAALAADPSLGLSQQVQTDVLGAAAVSLLGGQKPFVELRASLGALEARVEESVARNASERTATSLAKLELIEAEPYETVARYEEVRAQLESLYAITARSQRLSLAEFL